MAMPRPLSLAAIAPRASSDNGTLASNSSTARAEPPCIDWFMM
jgi:hypothetical protein